MNHSFVDSTILLFILISSEVSLELIGNGLNFAYRIFSCTKKKIFNSILLVCIFQLILTVLHYVNNEKLPKRIIIILVFHNFIVIEFAILSYFFSFILVSMNIIMVSHLSVLCPIPCPCPSTDYILPLLLMNNKLQVRSNQKQLSPVWAVVSFVLRYEDEFPGRRFFKLEVSNVWTEPF